MLSNTITRTQHTHKYLHIGKRRIMCVFVCLWARGKVRGKLNYYRTQHFPLPLRLCVCIFSSLRSKTSFVKPKHHFFVIHCFDGGNVFIWTFLFLWISICWTKVYLHSRRESKYRKRTAREWCRLIERYKIRTQTKRVTRVNIHLHNDASRCPTKTLLNKSFESECVITCKIPLRRHHTEPYLSFNFVLLLLILLLLLLS